MALEAGTRVGPYEVLSLVGVGGMGEVYKARDSRLDRIVAIKLLRADVAGRADRRARFDKEARAISSLSHPHICTLYDVGDDNGQPFIVMEYLEGETLDDRLTRGALPAADVLRFGVQIADALAHAHRAHIVHRDLKPSNVMLTSSGAKLLDFGLARRNEIEPMAVGSTTISFDRGSLTEEGTIVGTFQYMAPEQLQGKEADERTDIFAFGTLLFEMATGRKAFDARTQTGLIASILSGATTGGVATRALTRDCLQRSTTLVERCIAKDPDDRWQTARDLERELEWVASAGSSLTRTWSASVLAAFAPVVERDHPGGRGRHRVAVRPVADIECAGSADVTRFVIAPPPGSLIPFGEQRTRIALSPDGRTLAFVAFNKGRLQIWVQPLDSLVARPLDGHRRRGVAVLVAQTAGTSGFSRRISGELKQIDLSGGPPRTICAAAIEGLAEWGHDNTILFTVFRSGIFRVPADGGTPMRVTSLDKSRREINHYWPSFLPGGTHFIYLVTANATDTSKATPSVYVASLDGRDRQLLDRIHSRAVFVAPGYLLFEDEGSLLAQPFDLTSRHLTGEAVRVADQMAVNRTLGTAHFSVSTTGALAYLGSGDTSEMVWYDRQGTPSPTGWATQWYGEPRISPDSTARGRADVFDPRSGAADLWIYDLQRNVPTRFTTESPTDKNRCGRQMAVECCTRLNAVAHRTSFSRGSPTAERLNRWC